MVPRPAAAQAWVTPRGEGYATVAVQVVSSSDHVTRTGERNPNLGRESLRIVTGDVVYGVTDRLSTEVSLAWLATKWVGRIEDRHGPLDTGEYHGTVQDVRVAARYQLTEGRVNVAPFLAFTAPTTDYETRGHSSFGRHMEELSLGTSVGGRLGRFGYWQAIGWYAVVNDIDSEDFNLDHLNGDVEVGMSLGSRWAARTFASGQWMWDGLKLPPTDHFHLFEPVHDHDKYAQSSFLNVGAGVSYALNARFDLGLTAFTTVSSRNFHALNAIVSNITWKFGGGFRIAPPLSDVPTR